MSKNIASFSELSICCDQIIWSARKGHGSFITLEFGRPHVVAWTGSIKSGRKIIKKRKCKVVGDLTLWIEYCTWRILAGSRVAISSESADVEIYSFLPNLDGEVLNKIAQEDGKFIFYLDDYRLELSEDIELEGDLFSIHKFSGGILSMSPEGKIYFEDSPPRRDIFAL